MDMFIKYIFDRVVSFVGLIILSPLILIIALLIKVESPKSPVIFKQKRIGYQGKEFMMYKFRTMVDNHGGSSISVKGESRITALGAKLRRFKLDELPNYGMC